MRRQWQAIAQSRNRYANHLCPHRIASESIYLFLLFFTGHSCVVYGRHCNNNNSCDQWAEDKAIKPIASRTRDTMKHKRRNTKIESDEWMIANLWEIGTFENVPQTVPTGAKTSRETVRRFLFVDSICERNVTRFIEQSSCVCVCARYTRLLLPQFFVSPIGSGVFAKYFGGCSSFEFRFFRRNHRFVCGFLFRSFFSVFDESFCRFIHRAVWALFVAIENLHTT